MLLYICISSHGYGHAARQCSLLIELHRLCPSWRIVISTAVEKSFFGLSLQNIPFEYRYQTWDIGLIQNDALTINMQGTLYSLEQHYKTIDSAIEEEADWLRSQDLNILIIADIPPSASKLSQKIGSPLIFIANFGWDDIYSQLNKKFHKYAHSANLGYRKGDLLIRCPFSLKMDWGLSEKHITLTAAKPRKLPIQLKSEIISYNKKIIFFAFGGHGFHIDPSRFELWDNFLFLIPKSYYNEVDFNFLPHNCRVITENIRQIDLLPICYRLLCKPGYSSFCEALSLDIGLNIVERDYFPESSSLISSIRLCASHRIITKEAFYKGLWELDKPLTKPSFSPLDNNGAYQAAKIIRDFDKLMNK